MVWCDSGSTSTLVFGEQNGARGEGEGEGAGRMDREEEERHGRGCVDGGERGAGEGTRC